MSEASADLAAAGETNVEHPWRAGALAGVAGSLVMGGLVWLMNPPTLAVAIPALYGLAPPPNPLAGWVVHAAHGAVFGLAFAALVERAPGLTHGNAVRTVGLGVAYGVGVWVVAAALLMPLWLGAVGFPNAPPFPNFAPPSLLWHAVYGLVLGAVYVVVADR